MRSAPAELQQQLRTFQVADRAAAAAAVRVGLVNERIRVVAVSDGLTPEDAAGLGYDHEPDLQKAVDRAISAYGENSRVSVLMHGGDIFPDIEAPGA
jgi:hypothetical protein